MLSLLRRLETRALLLLLSAAAGIWGFLSIGGEVLEGETTGLDRRLLLMLRTPGDSADPIGPRTLEEAMRDVTALGGFTLLTIVTFVGALVLLLHGKRRHALVFSLTVILAQASSTILKTIYGRPRPDLVPHDSYVYSASFPSGHSMLAATTYLTLAMVISSLEPRRATKALVFALAVAVTVAVGFSRIYLGVHWPSDVLAGWCAGAAWAFAGWVVLHGLLRRAATEAAGDPPSA